MSMGNLIGNPGGSTDLVLDFHLMQSYRKHASQIFGSVGHWSVTGEVEGRSGDQLIRLYPTPKGVHPVVVQYIPFVTEFRSPQAQYVTNEMVLCEAKEMLGMARRKLAGIPTPDGGTLQLDGEQLVNEAKERRDELFQLAISLGEPLPIIVQ